MRGLSVLPRLVARGYSRLRSIFRSQTRRSARPVQLPATREPTAVTERRLIKAALQVSEARFRTAFRASPDAMAISRVDDGRIIEINDGFTQVFGHSREQALDRTSLEIGLWAIPEDRLRFIDLLEDGREVRNLEFPYRTRGGEIRDGMLSAGIIELEGELHVLTVVRDVTEHKRAQEALRASETKFASAFRASPDAILITTLPEGRILEANDGFTRISGFTRQEVVGRSTLELGLWLEPIDRERLVETLYQLGEVQEMPATMRTKTGELLPFLISSSLFQVMDQTCMVAVGRDISERQRAEAERERFVAELEAKNAELERFTYTVSHDLKSPLITIRGFLGLLERDLAAGDHERVARDVSRIRTATETMQHLLDDLLELSRIGRLVNPHEPIILSELAHQASDLVAGRLGERGVAVEIAPDMPEITGDRARLLEVLQNLIDNAAKFMGEQPEPRIEIDARHADGEVQCRVADNGIGIAPEYHEKIFDLFDRLDPEAEGTGIGLALVKRIIEVHGGRIWVESAGAGAGSTFIFALPDPADNAPERIDLSGPGG